MIVHLYECLYNYLQKDELIQPSELIFLGGVWVYHLFFVFRHVVVSLLIRGRSCGISLPTFALFLGSTASHVDVDRVGT